MAWLQLNVIETVNDDPEKPFRVSMQVVASQGIDREVFVMEIKDAEASDRYSYTATPADLTAYPAGRAAAEALENDIFFYRTDRVVLDFTTQKLASATVVQARSRIARLVKKAGERSEGAFGGAETYMFDSEDA